MNRQYRQVADKIHDGLVKPMSEEVSDQQIEHMLLSNLWHDIPFHLHSEQEIVKGPLTRRLKEELV